MNPNSRIYIAGHRGLVGSALMRALSAQGFKNIITASRSELNLLDQDAVNQFFKNQKIDYTIVAAAKVGGIIANSSFPADFLYENLTIATNVIHAAYKHKVKKLLYLGSSCIYPKACPQPIKEEYLLSGPLEPTNEAYAIAKIAGLKLCEFYRSQYGQNFIAAMPTNLYGPFDNFHPQNSHVLPALIRRFHEAKMVGAESVVVWGSGKPVRELLYSEDLANALIILMQKYNSDEVINVGTGQGLTIAEIAYQVKEVVGFEGSVVFDKSKPDGTPKKVLNIDKISRLGWKPTVPLKEGISRAYQWAVETDVLTPAENKLKVASLG
ncbi:MAG: GDP-L-fucose synthase [Proteobacteria bacterium]|nr:GDP-L-fucose synthase [Pseudomonadota bacterium]NBY19807.1 GDP-L-fucose synthase [bacterium]